MLKSCKLINAISKQYYHSRNILKLKDRGLWSDRFPSACLEFEQELLASPQTIYSGFDPTADSLHIGNLLVITTLLHCQRAGHKIIALIGGATGLIGDPSGKNQERPMLSSSVISENANRLKHSLQSIFFNHEQYFWDDSLSSRKLYPALILDNYEWTGSIKVIDLLRNVGRHMRMGSLLSRTSVQSRISSSQGLSLTEFTYQVLQAYDWLYLFDKYNCTIQIGGSDQMGNIVSGHDLISKLRRIQVTGLTVPLITSEEGDKYGKSSGSPLWLDSNRTSPYEFYQFFLRLKDSEVEKYLKLFTFYPVTNIESIMKTHWETPESRHAQKKLAEKLTLLVHGKEGLQAATKTTEILYSNRSESLADLDSHQIEVIFKNAPSCSLLLKAGISVLEMAMAAGCFKNENDAIRIIEAGGFYINQARVDVPSLTLIEGAHILPSRMTLARVGKF